MSQPHGTSARAYAAAPPERGVGADERRPAASGTTDRAAPVVRMAHGHILIVDDDPTILRSMARALRAKGFEVSTAENGEEAIQQLNKSAFDVILSDIAMPNMDGIQLLREVREHDLHVPVVLITGEPTVGTAVQALEYGAFHYLTKPARTEDVLTVIGRAVRLGRMARVKQQAAELLGHGGTQAADRAGLEASFGRAMSKLWVAYHPIVSVGKKEVFGYEALLRSDEPTLPHPGAVIGAAERLDRLQEVGRTIRERAALGFEGAADGVTLFVNLHPTDLLDPMLVDPACTLVQIASRVVLEITERSSLEDLKDVRARVAGLREVGFRIAVDDLGAGYAGLTSFAQLEPEIVKLDMSLIRDVHTSLTKQKVVRSMATLAQDMGMLVVAEGVETVEERDTLIELGCDLLQGFLFARPGRPFPAVVW